jgi:hypothetical protein
MYYPSTHPISGYSVILAALKLRSTLRCRKLPDFLRGFSEMKRYLFLAHRWLGVVMCLFFAMWFASGIVMMYVDYPALTEQERLDNLPALQIDDLLISVEDALELSQMEEGVAKIVLTSVANHPAYQLTDPSGRMVILYADSGRVFRGLSVEQALATARFSGFSSADKVASYDGKIDMDQWTVSSSLHRHRPLHKVSLSGSEGVVLYLSDTTGQIVRDTNQDERFWNWFGSTLHWIYPMQLRRHTELWVDVIVYLSLLGIFSVVTGGIIGIMRLRLRNRYNGGNRSPYKGIAKWHHSLGLLCLIFISTFIFSGLMSMGPWGIFSSSSSIAVQESRYVGGVIIDVEKYPALTWQDSLPVKEVEWQQIAGSGHLVFSFSAFDRQVVTSQERQSRSEELGRRIIDAVPSLLPHDQIVSIDVLEEFDDYYYSRHSQYRPLPVYRVKFNDEESTWFHLDMNTGSLVTRHTNASRLERWLYHGLHSLDFSFLIKNGILWDIIVIFLCSVGFVFSITSVVLGWRQLRT